MSLIRSQLTELSTQKTTAGFSSFFSILVALWGGSKAIKGLMGAMNFAYNESEERSYFRKKAIEIALIVGTLLVIIPATALFIYAGDRGSALAIIGSVLKWPAIFVGIALWISVLYRYAPCRSSAKWRWISHGAIIATALWMGTSFLFSLYASNFGNYNATYGSLGAVIVLLLWLYLSAISIIVGAQINAQIELETGQDTTVGDPDPVGERGAMVANNCAKN